MEIKIQKLITKGKSLVLAYDQGLEHGPTDFDDKNVDPDYIMDIAIKGKFSGIAIQKGIAEKYYHGKIPLILKLNGKTNLVKGDPVSRPLGTVKEAIDLGASAVGYTIYVGSMHETLMFKEFEVIQREAHGHGLPVMAWMYPRGKSIKNEKSKEILAYAARVGLELGVDLIKIKYSGDINSFKWVVKSAGRAKVLVTGGPKLKENELLKQTYDIMKTGAVGLAIGRNVWQHKHPLKITRALKKIIFENKSFNEAKKMLK